MVVPGMICRALFPRELNLPSGADTAYPLLVVKLLPPGLVGFVVASMLAALMSSLASVFNSSSTLFTLEIWQVARPNAGETELVRVGRGTVLAMCVVGMAWLPIVNNAQQLFVYIQSVSNYLSPPITVIFVIALFVKNARPLERPAFYSLMVGFTLGLARLICHIAYGTNEDNKGTAFTTMNFMYDAVFFFFVYFLLFPLFFFFFWNPKQKIHCVRSNPCSGACAMHSRLPGRLQLALCHLTDVYNLRNAICYLYMYILYRMYRILISLLQRHFGLMVLAITAIAFGIAACWVKRFAMLSNNKSPYSVGNAGGSGEFSNPLGSSGSDSVAGSDAALGVPTRASRGVGASVASAAVKVPLSSGTTAEPLLDERAASPTPRIPTTNSVDGYGDDAPPFNSPATYPASGSSLGSGEKKAGEGAEQELVGWTLLWQHIKEERRAYPWHGAVSALTVAIVLGMYIGFG